MRYAEAEANNIAIQNKIRGYLKNFPAIDPHRVGNLLGEGNEHYVVEYLPYQQVEQNQLGHQQRFVLKIPKVERKVKTFLTPGQLHDTYSQLQDYFGDAIPETYVLGSMDKDDPSYVIVQKEASTTPVTVEMLLQNARLREQFYHIIMSNYHMHQEKHEYLPLLGREGTFSTLGGKAKLTNIVVQGEGDNACLKVIDFGLLNNHSEDHIKQRREISDRYTRHHSLPQWIEMIKEKHPTIENLEVKAIDDLIKFETLVEDVTIGSVEAVRDGVQELANEIVLELYFIRALERHLGQKTEISTPLRNGNLL